MAQRKPYNPNTAYGRKKLREQAIEKYNNGTPEYRAQIDKTETQAWIVIVAIVIFVFFVICLVAGPEAAIKWLK